MMKKMTKCGCEVCETYAICVVRKFVRRVCFLAERKMLETGKLEGTHYAAMREIFKEHGIKFPSRKKDKR
jgi:hypothetical protein